MTPTGAIFQTARTVVRPLNLDHDAAALVPLYADPAVMHFIGGGTFDTEAAVLDFLTARLGRQAPPPLGFWAVQAKADGRLLGTALLDGIPLTTSKAVPFLLSPDVQLGGALRQDAWRQGYGHELALGLLTYARDVAGLGTVYALYEPDHPASGALLAKLGFGPPEETTAYYGGIRLLRCGLGV